MERRYSFRIKLFPEDGKYRADISTENQPYPINGRLRIRVPIIVEDSRFCLDFTNGVDIETGRSFREKYELRVNLRSVLLKLEGEVQGFIGSALAKDRIPVMKRVRLRADNGLSCDATERLSSVTFVRSRPRRVRDYNPGAI